MGQYGYNGRILWVDLTRRTHRIEEPGERFWRLYGGGGLAATYLLMQHTPAGVDPLGPDNLLIFASSVVAGMDGPGLARFTTAAKSPPTGGVGETRTEGTWGPALKASGVDIIVCTGRASEPVVVEILPGADDVRFHPATDLWGRTVGASTERIESQLGAGVHVAAIGPAGEILVRFASIVTDRSYQISRMGMGAVMGSKNVKAVALHRSDPPPAFDPVALDRAREEFAAAIPENSLSAWQHDSPGFSCWIYLHGLDASICVENYSKAEFAGLDAYREERFLEFQIRDLPCPSCPNNCIKSIMPHAAGESGAGPRASERDPRAGAIHQEITGAMGPNLGIADLPAVLEANRRCNEYGLDPTSLGFTISFAMECYREGIIADADNRGAPLRFGSAEDALRCVDDIAYRRGLGDTLAEGSQRAAHAFGGKAPALAMHVKGLEMVPFEPRSQTNLALGYAAAPMGPRYDVCEHDWDFDTQVGWEHTLRYSRTLGILERIPMEYQGPEKVRNFKGLLALWSAADALDFCIFAIAPTRILSLPAMAELLHAATGWETSSYEVVRYGMRRLHLMRLYNLREGLGRGDDVLPSRFYETPLAAGPQKGAVLDREAFAESIATFYAMMGWDEDGVPLPATLYDYGLEWTLGIPRS